MAAVLAGLIAGAALSLGTDEVMRALGVFPPWGQRVADGPLLLATVYRSIYNAAGSYLAARLAPARPMAHAIALGVVGLVLSMAGAAATWNKGPEFGPRWYSLALFFLVMPFAWAGGKLHGAISRRGD